MKPSVSPPSRRDRARRASERVVRMGLAALVCLAVTTGAALAASVDEAWEQLVAGEIAEAEATFRELIARDMTAPEPHRGLAECLRATGRLDAAIAELRRAIALGSTHPDVRLSLAELYSYRPENRREAEAMLDEILAERPHDPRARLALARTYGWDDDRDRARRAYDALLEESDLPAPIRRDAQVERGRLASWQGDLARAEADYTEVIARDGPTAAAAVGLAETALWAGDVDAARERARRIVRDDLDPSLAARLEVIDGRLALIDGDRRRALGHFDAAGQLDPANVDARSWRRRVEDARAPRAELRVELLRDANDVERLGMVVPIDAVLGRTAVRAGATWTRHEAEDRSVRRWSVPIQLARAWPSGVAVRAGYTLSVYDPEPRAGRTTHAGFLEVGGSLAARVDVALRGAVYDAANLADPFAPRFYNELIRLDVVDDALRMAELGVRLVTRPTDRWMLMADASLASLDDDSLFTDDGNTRRQGFARAELRVSSGLTVRGQVYALATDHRDPRIWSPAGFEAFGIGMRYERALPSTAWLMTDHGLSYEPDADGVGSEHRLQLGIGITGGIDLVGDAFYLQSPTNHDESDDRYTLRRFALSVRSTR